MYRVGFITVTPELFFPTQLSQYIRFAKPNDLQKAYIKAEHFFSHMEHKYSLKKSFGNIATKRCKQSRIGFTKSVYER